MKGNSVQHRRKLGPHFAFRFASVDARITGRCQWNPLLLWLAEQLPRVINRRFFPLTFFFSFHDAVSAEKCEFFFFGGRELFT